MTITQPIRWKKVIWISLLFLGLLFIALIPGVPIVPIYGIVFLTWCVLFAAGIKNRGPFGNWQPLEIILTLVGSFGTLFVLSIFGFFVFWAFEML